MVVVPAVIAVTLPDASTLACPDPSVLQDPPLAASVRAIDAPVHSVPGPVIAPAAGSAFTVTICTAITAPQLFVAV